MSREKKLFFIQVPENYYTDPDQSLIEQLSIEKQLEPCFVLTLYQKLILVSLRNDGFIYSYNGVITPLQLIGLTRFKTLNGLKKDMEFVDKAIQLLEELNLVTVQPDKIYMEKAVTLAMSKQEDSQRRLDAKKKNEFEFRKIKFIKSGHTPEEAEKLAKESEEINKVQAEVSDAELKKQVEIANYSLFNHFNN